MSDDEERKAAERRDFERRRVEAWQGGWGRYLWAVLALALIGFFLYDVVTGGLNVTGVTF